jgi:hypothetical protein
MAEVDFVWLSWDRNVARSEIILGECKDRGELDPDEFKAHFESMRGVAELLPPSRFKVYFLFSKMSKFTSDEIAIAKTFNSEFERRVILLTPEELEPYLIPAWKRDDAVAAVYANDAANLAVITALKYFQATDAGE